MNIPRVSHSAEHIDLGPDASGQMRRPLVENPWLTLPTQPPYVLEIDRDAIELYNSQEMEHERRIDTSLIPEPFIGNPKSAKLVLLSLNPGRDEGDTEAHSDPEFKAAMFRNLRHETQEYPFYPLDPRFKGTPCARWWLKKTRRLVAECGLDRVASGLLVVEHLPYHSCKKPLGLACASQQYSFQLVKRMLDERDGGRALVVLMRSQNEWVAVDGRCSDLPLPNSPQNPTITPRNFSIELFERMKAVICNGDPRR